ncbi:MAG: metallophosphoesterase [Polyangiales bacterium]
MPAPSMDAWRRRFTARVLTFACVSQLPVTATLCARVIHRGAPVLATLLAAALLLVVANVPLVARLREWRDHERRSIARVWLIELPYFAWFAAAVFFALTFAPAALVASLSGLALIDALSAWAALSAIVGVYSVFVRRLWTPVAQVDVPIVNLDPSLDGFTFAQLSDVHCGPYVPRWFLRRLAKRASSLGADVCVVTGDCITEGEGYVDDVAELVAHLRAPRGVFACLGNHDYFGTIDGARLALERGGATVLRNAGALVRKRDEGAAIYLAGIDDNWTGRDDLARAMSEKPERVTTVLLAHDPSLFDALVSRAEIDLVLSGHTHAGQIGVPFVTHRFNLGRVKFRRSVGLSRSRDGRSAIFVHPGNGTSGPPIRFGVAPVIARITLRRAPTGGGS